MQHKIRSVFPNGPLKIYTITPAGIESPASPRPISFFTNNCSCLCLYPGHPSYIRSSERRWSLWCKVMCVSQDGRTRGARRLEVGAYMCKRIVRLGIRRYRHSCSQCNHLKHEQVSEPLTGARVFGILRLAQAYPCLRSLERVMGVLWVGFGMVWYCVFNFVSGSVWFRWL